MPWLLFVTIWAGEIFFRLNLDRTVQTTGGANDIDRRVVTAPDKAPFYLSRK